MATQNGSNLVILLDDTLIPCQADTSSMTMDRDMIETTCKDSTGSWKTYIPGEKGATMDGTINLDWAEANGLTDLFSKFDNGTLTVVKWGETASGGKYFTGSAYLSNLTPDGPQNDKGTASFTMTFTGPITEGTVV